MTRNFLRSFLLFLGIMVCSVVSVAAQGPTVQSMQKEGLGLYLAEAKA